jgi:hypothetical protein
MPQISIEVSDEVAERLAVLAQPGYGLDTQLTEVVGELIDHAQQGVYRPGSWERPWLEQAFGYEWTARVVPDERPDRLGADGNIIFDRPMGVRTNPDLD